MALYSIPGMLCNKHRRAPYITSGEAWITTSRWGRSNEFQILWNEAGNEQHTFSLRLFPLSFPVLIPTFLSRGNHTPWELLPHMGAPSPSGQQQKASLLFPANCYYLTLLSDSSSTYCYYQCADGEKRVSELCLRSQSRWAAERCSKPSVPWPSRCTTATFWPPLCSTPSMPLAY